MRESALCNMCVEDEDMLGRGLPSSSSLLNLSRFWHSAHPLNA